jgi:hypothetical protein
LSWCPDYDDGFNDNEGTVALPETIFGRIIEATALDQMVEDEQENHTELLRSWEKTHKLRQNPNGHWYKDAVLVVPPDERLQRALVKLNHDSTIAAHLGVEKTCYALMKQYWWPSCWKFVQKYVQFAKQTNWSPERTIPQLTQSLQKEEHPPLKQLQ